MSGVVVYKLGGPALEDPGLTAPLAAELRRAGGRVVVVHGGGRRIERMLEELGIASRFVDGRRETSPEAMDVVEMVLSGTTNKGIAAALTAAGVPAVGISGRDGGLLLATPLPDLGRVGTDVRVASRAPIEALWAAQLVPVVSPVSSGPQGEALNVNADEAALGLARSLGARTLVYLSDVDGVRLGGGGPAAPELSAREAGARIDDGTIAGGMALKVRVALAGAASGIDVVIAGKARLTGGFPGTRVVAVPQEVQA